MILQELIPHLNNVHERNNSIKNKNPNKTDGIGKKRKDIEWKKIRNKAIAAVSAAAFLTAGVAIGGLWLFGVNILPDRTPVLHNTKNTEVNPE